MREVIGYEVPIAIDHFGHVCVEDCIRFAKRMEKYNLAWIEDMVPWIYPDQIKEFMMPPVFLCAPARIFI